MDAAEPFELLLEIAARARSDVAEAHLRVQPHWTGIGFSVLGQRLVAPIGSVTEILMVPPLTRLPRVQPWVKGVANVRGRLLPVIGLPSFLGGRSALHWREHRVLVLGDTGTDCGVVVDEVLGLKHFAAESFREDVAGVGPELAPFVAGVYSGVDGDWAVFRPDLLVADQRFQDAAR